VVTWKGRQNESGLAVSQVKRIEDELTKHAVVQILKETENIYIHNVNFL
jgi:hypothetical protein